MKLGLFSFHITKDHITRLELMAQKPIGKCSLCFVITAARPYLGVTKDYPDWLKRNTSDIEDRLGRIETFDIMDSADGFDHKEYFSKFDIVYFSGGNVFYLLYALRDKNVDSVILDLINSEEIVYMGGSAGAVVLAESIKHYETIDEPETAPERTDKGLGLIDFAPIIHWGSEKYSDELTEIKRKYEAEGKRTITIKDNEAVFVENDKIEKI